LLFPPFVQKIPEVKGWETAFFSADLFIFLFGLSLPGVLFRGRGCRRMAAYRHSKNRVQREKQNHCSRR
jgi:hypothetical protein